MRTYKNNVLMGDFNFSSTWKDEQVVITNNHYTDIYLDLNNQKEDFTMPTTGEFSKWRPDKIIMPLSGQTNEDGSKKENMKYEPESIHIVGKFSIPLFEKEPYTMVQEDSIVRTPSDHMG
eukprot:CAMPEP_0170549996 /NCGR_PEP_ID=MMETSP0211-20121228/8057_1 /TAXON_ID=311385 /ORGANISM="Pseudokeronopsis sp., Strain OXSARD2" /LENGTH=119 /DNA_ID=CAMNT_0010856257 /DNA_START=451 /DNA_END=807 /DNA_ORIENTATION=-